MRRSWLLTRREFRRESPEGSAENLRKLQDVIYTDFLRESHAARGAEVTMERFGPTGTSDYKIRVGEVNYAEHVALVCKSHWENATALKGEQYRRDAYISTFPVNLQYCSVILRLADLIELDPERTPKVLLDFLLLDLEPRWNSKDDAESSRVKSAQEWAKHRAVLGYKISPEEVRIEAKCSHPAIQRGLREWCDYIDRERQDCRLIVRDNWHEITERYELLLESEVRPDYIQSDGSYIYSDFQFQLDYERIVELLMGTELWGDPAVVVRELLQNAIDACHHRAALSKLQQIPYTPRIVFRLSYADKDADSDSQFSMTLTCDDNGTGMDQRIVETFLMRIGRSYYQSSEFRRQNLSFYPISHFGLGIMSCFMLTDKVQLETQRLAGGTQSTEPILVEITSSGRYVVIRPITKSREGTAVALGIALSEEEHLAYPFGEIEHFQHGRVRGRIREPMFVLDQTFDILERLAVHLDIPIEVEQGDRGRVTIPVGDYVLPDIDWSPLLCMKGRCREFVFSFSHEQTGGLAGKFRFLLPLTDDGKLCFGCAVESLFKMFIDLDGDLCLTTPGYEDKRMNLAFGIEEKWSHGEIRGIYRHKFEQKPPSGPESEYDADYGLLEVVKASFRWSQDGLYVGPLTSRQPVKENEEEKKSEPPNVFADVLVPGLNAADIDIRGPWRVRLNVQRSDFQRGAALEAFRQRYFSLAAGMWKEIVYTPGLFSSPESRSRFVRELIQQANWQLRSYLQNAISNPPEPTEGAVSA